MCLMSFNAYSQQKDTVDFVNFEEAKHGVIFSKEKMSIFTGEVAFNHKGVYFYADTVIRNDQMIRAIGNVLIQQGDTLAIFADSLHYNADTRQCDLFSDVSFTKGEQRLYTERLSYNTHSKIATFDNNGTFTNGPTWVKSHSAIYDTNTDDIILSDRVFVQDPDFDIKTSKLKYNSKLRYVNFLAPAIVSQKDGTRLYSESGFYDIGKKYGEFIGNPQYQKGKEKAIAKKKMVYDGINQYYHLLGEARYQDSLRYVQGQSIKYFQKREFFEIDGGNDYAFLQDSNQMLKGKLIKYDKKKNILKTVGRSRIEDKDFIIESENNDFNNETGKGLSKGNVIIYDKENKTSIHAEITELDKKKEFMKAYGKRAMFSIIQDTDTLHISADTLLSFKKDSLSGDTSRIVQAFHDVKIFSIDVQGVCDSMYYTSLDSIFRMYNNPILWTDTTNQYSADSIFLFQKDKSISKILMQNKALILNSPDEVYFNQMGGKEIVALLDDNKLKILNVNRNAQTVFYNQNEQKEYTGVNTLDCSNLTAYFEDNKLDRVKFYKQNDGKYYPMTKANHAAIQLPGFKWEIARRPLSLKDLRSEDGNVQMFTLTDLQPSNDTEVNVDQIQKDKPTKEKIKIQSKRKTK